MRLTEAKQQLERLEMVLVQRRRGLRVGDLLDEELFTKKLKDVVDYHNFSLEQYFNQTPVDFDNVLLEALNQAKIIKPMIMDVADELHKQMDNSENILFEGAQGALLDLSLIHI